MLMIKTGAAGFGKNMGKAMEADSASQGLGNDFSAVLNSLMGKVSRSENIGEKNLAALMNIEGAPGSKTNAVIEALSAVLTGQQASKSADLYVGSKGLDALGKLLEQAGFDGEKVKSFILEKKQSMENEDSTGASLQTLLASIGEFMKQNDQGAVLDISTLPYISSALNSFGFKPEKVENILNVSTDEKQGIDVDKLLTELAPYTTAKDPGFAPNLTNGAIKEADVASMVKNFSSVASDNMNTANSADRIMAMLAASAAKSAVNVESVLNEAAKGEITLDQFAAKLNSLAEGGGSSSEKQSLTDGFAKIFGENVHGLKRSVVTEGVKTFTTVETIDPMNAELRFDTKNPASTLFTEKAEGMFKGNLKGTDGQNTWVSENSAAAVDGKTGENMHAGELNPAALKNNQNEKMAAYSDDSSADQSLILLEKAAKEKPAIIKDKGDMPIIPVKALAGTGFYNKISEVTQTNITEKTLPAYVTDQVAKQISKAIRNGDSEIKFHIKPPDMGRVELSIAHTANGLKISILAEHSSTRDMLMNQASDLKSILADQGIRLEKMDVGMSGDFGGQSMAQAKHDSDQSNKGRKQKDKPVFSMDPLSNEPRENAMGNLMAAGRYTRGKLDLVA